MNKSNLIDETNEIDDVFSQKFVKKEKGKRKPSKKSKDSFQELQEESKIPLSQKEEAVWFIDDEPPKDNAREIFVRPPTPDELKSDVVTSAS